MSRRGILQVPSMRAPTPPTPCPQGRAAGGCWRQFHAACAFKHARFLPWSLIRSRSDKLTNSRAHGHTCYTRFSPDVGMHAANSRSRVPRTLFSLLTHTLARPEQLLTTQRAYDTSGSSPHPTLHAAHRTAPPHVYLTVCTLVFNGARMGLRVYSPKPYP